MLYVACVIIVERGAILLVKKGNFWILPGGKIEEGESDAQCIFREICDEEIPTIEIKELMYFRNFLGTTPSSRRKVCASVYFAEATGLIVVREEDSIREARLVKNPLLLNLSDVTRDVTFYLQTQGFLNRGVDYGSILSGLW
ncbi:NUDIX domain-containing protein [Patescibacteria group bacterium]|nr:NUDIX domain-containing protein [Patescibacteria group bacterium]